MSSLKVTAPHDLHEDAILPAEREIDDEDAMDMLEECYIFLATIIDDRNVDENQLVKLYNKIDEVLSFTRIH